VVFSTDPRVKKASFSHAVWKKPLFHTQCEKVYLDRINIITLILVKFPMPAKRKRTATKKKAELNNNAVSSAIARKKAMMKTAKKNESQGVNKTNSWSDIPSNSSHLRERMEHLRVLDDAHTS
jgi:hypothetical protein